jgi:predicted transcriptional regulator
MKSATVSAKLEPSIAEKLDLLAKATARSRSFLVAEAIETYVKDQAWQIKAIQAGIEEADKGKFATDKEVTKTFKSWGVNAA